MTAWTTLASKELSTFASSLPRHRLQRAGSVAGSVAGIFYTGEVDWLAEVSVTEQILWEFPNPGKPSMRKQCVPGSFLPAHAQEPGNEAKSRYTTGTKKSVHFAE